MLHLTLAHYYEIMSCHLQTEVVVYPIVYKCLQVGCHLGFKTIPALLSHEQMKHRAFEKFIGTIIGRNDLYKELHWWVRNVYFLGILAGKIGIKPERSPVARLRICFLVLSIVTPIELINRGEQAPAPSHWRPKHPFLSKQKVGWPKVGRSLWQQLKRKRFDSDDRSCVSFVSFKPHTVLKYHSKILMIEWTNYSDTIKVKISEKIVKVK